MTNIDIIRAWKDEEYRTSLDGAALPGNPAGVVALTDEQMGMVAGAGASYITNTSICETYSEKCPRITDACTQTIKGPDDFSIRPARRW